MTLVLRITILRPLSSVLSFKIKISSLLLLQNLVLSTIRQTSKLPLVLCKYFCRVFLYFSILCCILCVQYARSCAAYMDIIKDDNDDYDFLLKESSMSEIRFHLKK